MGGTPRKANCLIASGLRVYVGQVEFGLFLQYKAIRLSEEKESKSSGIYT